MDIRDNPRASGLLTQFAAQTQAILGENLTGVYLHGSAVMGCYQPGRSDLDLLVVVEQTPSDTEKRRLLDMTVAIHRQHPPKGVEMSVMRRAVCKPFVYPTPFELHFSGTHLQAYRRDPEAYIARMQGTDKDLAAHCTVLLHRGRALAGLPIHEVFGEVPPSAYWDSLRYDVENAVADILENPVYVTLNLCRVLAYRREGLVLSKSEGGWWGLNHLPEEWHDMVREALAEYEQGAPMHTDSIRAAAFAAYMLYQINQ